jgi:hypothetical protein
MQPHTGKTAHPEVGTNWHKTNRNGPCPRGVCALQLIFSDMTVRRYNLTLQFLRVQSTENMGLDPISSRKVARAVATSRQHLHADELPGDHDGDRQWNRAGASLPLDSLPCRVGTDSGLFPAPLRCASILAHCGGRRSRRSGFRRWSSASSRTCPTWDLTCDRRQPWWSRLPASPRSEPGLPAPGARWGRTPKGQGGPGSGDPRRPGGFRGALR